jgi:hypothetical protein
MVQPEQIRSDELDDDDVDEIFGTVVLSTEDQLPSRTFLPLIDMGCSLEDYRIILNEKNPRNAQWRDVATPIISNVSATLEGARQLLWNQAICEIGSGKNKVKDALRGKKPTITKLFDLIFGPQSNIGCKIQAKLQISNEDFLKQLGVYNLAAAYNLSKMQNYSKQSFINTEGLSDEKSYQAFWDCIERNG